MPAAPRVAERGHMIDVDAEAEGGGLHRPLSGRHGRCVMVSAEAR
jgi:hypothetical protein